VEYKIIDGCSTFELQIKINHWAELGWKLVTTDIKPPRYIATIAKELND